MASHFLFHGSASEVVPWNAKYQFPSQATRSQKATVKIPPKNKQSGYNPGEIIRIEFPAQGYMDSSHSVLQFDLSIRAAQAGFPFIQGDGHSAFKRGRLLYGSLVIEDIQNYAILSRIFYNVAQSVGFEQSTNAMQQGGGSVEQKMGYWQMAYQYLNQYSTSTSATQRVCLNLNFGLLQNKKLLPLKWMSSQLALELEVALAQDVICSGTTTNIAGTTNVSTMPTGDSLSMTIDNINFIAEILEFDSSYDASFYEGLKSGGVPIKFSSWHTNIFNVTGSTMQLQIQERSRAVKSAFAVQVLPSNTSTYSLVDTHAFFHAGVQTFQWRLGSRYFPAQPVQVCGLPPSSTSAANYTTIPTTGAEATVELEKALNTLDNWDLSMNVNPVAWVGPFKDNNCPYTYYTNGSVGKLATAVDPTGIPTFQVIDTGNSTGLVASVNNPLQYQVLAPTNDGSITMPPSRPIPTGQFVMATSFETSNGAEISGVNAEELSDLSLIVTYAATPNLYNVTIGTSITGVLTNKTLSNCLGYTVAAAQSVPTTLQVNASDATSVTNRVPTSGTPTTQPQIITFVYYDALLIIKENNVVDLIQ